jgi:hypothetical protein
MRVAQEVIGREAALGDRGLAFVGARDFNLHAPAEPVGFLSSSRRNVVLKSGGTSVPHPKSPRLDDHLASLPGPLPSLPPAHEAQAWSRVRTSGGSAAASSGRGALIKGNLGFRPVVRK